MRITFHNHDQVGASLCRELARRLRWSREDGEQVAALVADHMRPFHLNNVRRQAPLSLRACLRYLRGIGEELAAAMVLALADARAGRGEGRPERVEDEVLELFALLLRVRQEHVLPVRSAPPLITGHDLIAHFGLVPGPRFAPLLRRLEEAQMEGLVHDRAEALQLLTAVLAQPGDVQAGTSAKETSHA
jgi:poly(A) polymerase